MPAAAARLAGPAAPVHLLTALVLVARRLALHLVVARHEALPCCRRERPRREWPQRRRPIPVQDRKTAGRSRSGWRAVAVQPWGRMTSLLSTAFPPGASDQVTCQVEPSGRRVLPSISTTSACTPAPSSARPTTVPACALGGGVSGATSARSVT